MNLESASVGSCSFPAKMSSVYKVAQSVQGDPAGLYVQCRMYKTNKDFFEILFFKWPTFFLVIILYLPTCVTPRGA